MNGNDNNQKQESNPMFLLYLGLGFVFIKLYEKEAPKVALFFHNHQFQISATLAVTALTIAGLIAAKLWNGYYDHAYSKEITAGDSTAILLGRDERDNEVFLKQAFRTSHTQVIGTTGVGKTRSVILPAIIKDIENGSGMIIIDGKSDKAFLEELYSNVVKAGREDSFRLFSLSDIGPSSGFNPLQGGTPQEVAERVFSSFTFENEYYRNVQYKIFLGLLRLVAERKQIPTLRLVHRLLTDMDLLKSYLNTCQDEDLKRMLTYFSEEPMKDRTERMSGLDAHLSHFSQGTASILFNAKEPDIQMDRALKQRHIVYFQLPTMYYPFLGAATGKLVLQCFQNAVAKRHLGIATKPGFFSCYLDDFQDYIYDGFASLLNKANSAKIGVVFSHQALGDLDEVSPSFRNKVLVNTNIKIVMRSNDPDTCEYYAKSFGTKTTEKVTERKTATTIGDSKTGEGSVREVESFTYHPNLIRQLKTGEAIVAIPHPMGVKTAKIRFQMKEPLAPVPLPDIEKELAPIPTPVQPKKTDTTSL